MLSNKTVRLNIAVAVPFLCWFMVHFILKWMPTQESFCIFINFATISYYSHDDIVPI